MRVAPETLAWSEGNRPDHYGLTVWQTRTRGCRVEARGPKGDVTKPGFRTPEAAITYARRVAAHMAKFDMDEDDSVDEAKQRFLEEP